MSQISYWTFANVQTCQSRSLYHTHSVNVDEDLAHILDLALLDCWHGRLVGCAQMWWIRYLKSWPVNRSLLHWKTAKNPGQDKLCTLLDNETNVHSLALLYLSWGLLVELVGYQWLDVCPSTFSNLLSWNHQGQLNSNFIWKLLRMRKRVFFQMILLLWPRWLPRPYRVKTLLQNQKASPEYKNLSWVWG